MQNKNLFIFSLLFYILLIANNVLAENDESTNNTNGIIFDEGIFMFMFMFILFSVIFLILFGTHFLQMIRDHCRNDYDHEQYANRWKTIKSKSFKKNKFKQFCGVEIEAINKHQRKNKIEGKDNFSCGEDSSLNSDGAEFTSDPMQGDKLLSSVSRLCKKLNNKEWFVDKSCGLHLHIQTQRELDMIKKIYIFYNKYEKLFFKMMPQSRRNNQYCKKFKDSHSLKDFYNAEDLEGFMKLFYETNWYSREANRRYYKKRYCWINLHSIFYRGTLEIRCHSGTTNSKKITNWIMINLSIINKLEKMSVDEVYKLKDSEEKFLSFFNKSLKDYIRKRWAAFPKLNEEKFN